MDTEVRGWEQADKVLNFSTADEISSENTAINLLPQD